MTPSLAELEAAVREGYMSAIRGDMSSQRRLREHLDALSLLVARAREMEEAAHWTRRMLQALDAYWEHYEGLSNAKLRTVRSMSTGEVWWIRYERYRERVESAVLSGAGREKPA